MPKASRKSGAIKCLACKAPEVYTRGVCRRCYQNSRNLILKGETTDQQLVEIGVILPTRQRPNAIRQALAKR